MKDLLNHINPNYTLFLDRDGVINHENPDGYINSWQAFVFYEGVLQAMQLLNPLFKHIVLVTNQRGVGRGITQLADLQQIHQNMQVAISQAGGRIDGIYFCADVDSNSYNRKPNPGMAYQARQHFPAINFAQSVMVGNSPSDMAFGRAIGASTIFLTTTNPAFAGNQLVDAAFDSLLDFAKAISNR
jgi:histidinol-phosphate phosphatase family protein